eukprot:gene6854-9385_t
MASAIRIGLFGGGIVGGGVYELLQRSVASKRFNALGLSVEVVKICVRDATKPRDFTVNNSVKFVTNYDDILNDDSINCVIELMGGVTHAKQVVFGAIAKGKHVITANKALIATFLPELQQALAQNPAVRFCFEAAVCGGIPIIHSLQTDFLGDEITKVMGIMNGTTNFMLCKMEDEGAEYGAALGEAQRLGFAEADPTADVEGHDVQAKIALLAKLSFGKSVPFETVPTTGISKIAKVDFEYAKSLRSTIKLLGTATRNSDGTLAVFVSPTLVPLTSPLSSAKGPGNMVLINSLNMNSSTFAGPGAGRYPTANSVVNDIIRLAQGKTLDAFPYNADEIVLNNDYLAKFYIRIKCSDGLGIIRDVGDAAAQSGVSIHAILQNPILNYDNLDFVVTTETVALSNIKSFTQAIAKMPFAKEEPLFMPIL